MGWQEGVSRLVKPLALDKQNVGPARAFEHEVDEPTLAVLVVAPGVLLVGYIPSMDLLTSADGGKRAGVAQCAGGDFQGRLRESAEFCPAYSCSDRRRLISGKTSSITVSSAIALPKAVSRRSSN